MTKFIALLLGCFMFFQAHAFQCFLTLVKDSCWTNYNVNVVITNASTGKAITDVNVYLGKSWNRVQFECQPGETLSFSASFTPVFWQSDQGKVYPGFHDWTLPLKPAKGETAWNITLCYPEQFSEVPLPPTAGNSCKCNKEDIPPPKP